MMIAVTKTRISSSNNIHINFANSIDTCKKNNVNKTIMAIALMVIFIVVVVMVIGYIR